MPKNILSGNRMPENQVSTVFGYRIGVLATLSHYLLLSFHLILHLSPIVKSSFLFFILLHQKLSIFQYFQTFFLSLYIILFYFLPISLPSSLFSPFSSILFLFSFGSIFVNPASKLTEVGESNDFIFSFSTSPPHNTPTRQERILVSLYY